MINMETLRRFPVEDRKKLVDYMEGMPVTLNRFLKMNIMHKDMDPSFFHSGTRNVHDYGTLGRYLNKKIIHTINNPELCDYQKEYCQIMCILCDDNSMLDSSIRCKLEGILNSECYNLDTLIRVEVCIGEFLKDLMNDKEFMALPDQLYYTAYLITTKIMPYKSATYDLYGYIDHNEDIQLAESDYRRMTNLTAMICSLMKKNPNVTALHDLSSLIYSYFKELGMESHIDKYNLMARFSYAMKYAGISNEEIDDVIYEVNELVARKTNIISATDTIVNANKLSRVAKLSKDSISPLDISPNMSDFNGYIFSFKDIRTYGADFLGDLSVKLSTLTKDEILQYTDIPEDRITFELNENDIGHFRNEIHIPVGTIYNSFNSEIRYICEKDGEFYLLFKDVMNSRTVYGISVNKLPSSENMDRPRQVITVKESSNFFYKYIPEI